MHEFCVLGTPNLRSRLCHSCPHFGQSRFICRRCCCCLRCSYARGLEPVFELRIALAVGQGLADHPLVSLEGSCLTSTWDCATPSPDQYGRAQAESRRKQLLASQWLSRCLTDAAGYKIIQPTAHEARRTPHAARGKSAIAVIPASRLREGRAHTASMARCMSFSW